MRRWRGCGCGAAGPSSLPWKVPVFPGTATVTSSATATATVTSAAAAAAVVSSRAAGTATVTSTLL